MVGIGSQWVKLGDPGPRLSRRALTTLFFGGEYLQRLVRYREVREPVGVVPAVTLAEPVRRIVINTLGRDSNRRIISAWKVGANGKRRYKALLNGGASQAP